MLDKVYAEYRQKMTKTIEVLETEFARIRTARAIAKSGGLFGSKDGCKRLDETVTVPAGSTIRIGG